MNTEPVRPAPPGTIEIPGYIVEGCDGIWLTRDGYWTKRWSERGVWDTAEQAAEAKRKAFEPETT